MATTNEHAVLLDQLQTHVNLILEQTGRVFAAINSNPKVPPVAQATKLRNTLPTATGRFHEALDLLENELQMASLVMRRDLAVCRERSGQQAQVEVQGQPVEKADAEVTNVSPAEKEADTAQPSVPNTRAPEAEMTATAPADDEDVSMQDIQHEESKPIVSFDELIANENVPEEPPLADTKPSVAAHTLPTSGDENPANPGLQIDTKREAEDSKADEKPTDDADKPPDTANDLDSLFGGPVSATGGENTEFDFDQDDPGDIDFGSFGADFDSNGADNDNISSLLPGLEDYANTQPNASDVDLNALFGTANGGDGGNGMDSQGAGEHRDTTFDDLMDLANFDGGDMGGNGSNNNQDFDFDSLFN